MLFANAENDSLGDARYSENGIRSLHNDDKVAMLE